MPNLPIPDMWKPKITPTGIKLVPRPDRECPKCYEVGEIVNDEPINKKLGITRKCQNEECDFFGKEWSYSKSWEDYGKSEKEDYTNYLLEKGGSRPGFSRTKTEELWAKKKPSSNST